MTTEELLDLVFSNFQRGLHTSMPGRVESYDAATQTCEVLPQLKRQTPDGEGGYTTEDLPVLPHVPVCFPRGGGFFMSFPLQKGDFVLVVFSERAIGNWRQKGEASNPGDLRMHSLAGAVAIPGVFPNNPGPPDDASSNSMVIGKDGTSAAQVELTDSLVKLGGGDNFVALANRVNDELTKIRTAFNAHTHNYLPGPGAAVASTTPSAAYTRVDVDAQNVKAT